MPAVLALVRDLVDWLPTSAHWAGVVAGPLVLLGYLVGTIPVGYLLSRRRLRRQLARPDTAELARSADSAQDGDPLDVPGVVATAAITAVLTLAVTTVAWDVGLEVAPRGGISAVGTFSNQAIGAWASIALWTGMGAVVGQVAPLWTRFRGGSGLAPAVALLAAYAPMVFAAGVGAFLLALAVTRHRRRALLVALPAIVAFEYVAWLADLQGAWGVTNGPELAVWTAVLAGVLFARNLRGDTGQ